MRIIPQSLQWRTALSIALAFFVFLTLFFATSYVSIHRSLLYRSDSEVRRELERFAAEIKPGLSRDTLAHILSENRSIGESPLRDVFLASHQGNVLVSIGNGIGNLPSNVMMELKLNHGQPLSYSTSEGDMRLISIRHADFIIGASYNMIVLEEAEDSIIHVFAYYLAGGLFVGILGGIILSKYLIGPIGSLAATAKSILHKPEQSLARLPVSKSIEEVAALARSINELLDARERAMERQRNFAADAAHELRTPLTVLKGEIEVELRLTQAGSPHVEVLRSNLEEIDRLISTVQDLLELAEIESETSQDSRESQCSIQSAILYAANRLRSLASERGIAFDLPTEDVTIAAEEKRITRLIYNLLLNAVQHSSKGGRIFVRVHSSTGGGILEIEDQGTGIPPDRLAHLFERFYRTEGQAADSRGGAGLGLAIVKSIADHYGFTLSVRSSEHSGTTVFVSLPQSAIIG